MAICWWLRVKKQKKGTPLSANSLRTISTAHDSLKWQTSSVTTCLWTWTAISDFSVVTPYISDSVQRSHMCACAHVCKLGQSTNWKSMHALLRDIHNLIFAHHCSTITTSWPVSDSACAQAPHVGRLAVKACTKLLFCTITSTSYPTL